MKWKKYYGESVDDSSGSLDASEEPVKIIEVFDVLPIQYSINGMNEDAYNLIEEYIRDIAAKYYTNGEIPEDEDEKLRESLVAVGVAFEFLDQYIDYKYVDEEIVQYLLKNITDKGGYIKH